MKLLWLCNMAPGIAREKKGRGGLWIDHVLADLRCREDITIRILFPGKPGQQDCADDRCSYASFQNGLPYEYLPSLEEAFGRELSSFSPDVIHIWGTEYAHILAMVNAAEKAGFLDRLAVSIQGLCSVYTDHYAEGLPRKMQTMYTFRDLIRRDNVLQQQNKFALRGKLEVKALEKVRHVIGRTAWDRACTERINPDAQYHFCNETLREEFYEGRWSPETCRKHRIFASSCTYPVKGFHYLLEAFAQVLKKYPDATLAVPGKTFFCHSFREKLRQSSYQRYLEELAIRHGLEERIEFLGTLDERGMKENYLKANVFVLPSTIENSPNSLGEAMLLGVPCVSADVGGVTTMMIHETEGYVYQSTASYMLAHYIDRVFSLEEKAVEMGAAARNHAKRTHDPETNLNTLLSIYESIKI